MELEYIGGTLFVRLKGNLTRKNNYKINNYLNPVLKKHKIKKLVYNLKDLKEIDETSIDAILKTKCTVRKNRGLVYFSEVNEHIEKKVRRLHIKLIDCLK